MSRLTQKDMNYLDEYLTKGNEKVNELKNDYVKHNLKTKEPKVPKELKVPKDLNVGPVFPEPVTDVKPKIKEKREHTHQIHGKYF